MSARAPHRRVARGHAEDRYAAALESAVLVFAYALAAERLRAPNVSAISVASCRCKRPRAPGAVGVRRRGRQLKEAKLDAADSFRLECD
jgi:hypothetical protein